MADTGRSNAQKWAFRRQGLGYERIVGREADVQTPGNWASERRKHCFKTLLAEGPMFERRNSGHPNVGRSGLNFNT